MPAPTDGIARITIRAPRRRLDLAVPDQVPLAEILPEVLRRAGEPLSDPALGPDHRLGVGPGGWALRRADGVSLAGATALSHQGVRDGDVLYLVPRQVTWPEPRYDDVVEEIAVQARRHGSPWDASATRLFALVAAGLVLVAGLGGLLAAGPRWTVPAAASGAVAVVLVAAGALMSRALGDGVAGAAAGGFALPYAAAAGILGLAGDTPIRGLGAEHVLVGSTTLLLASVVGAAAVGHGLRIFAAGVTVGIMGAAGAILGFTVSGPGAASIVVVALVAAIGAAPLVAVRLGRLPIPVVSAAPEVVASEIRPDPPSVLAAVARADEILSGSLLGLSVVAVGAIAVVGSIDGIAGPLLGVLAALALLLRARLFPAVANRLPLLTTGLLGLVLVGWSVLGGAGHEARLIGAAIAFAAVVALLASAGVAYRPRQSSPYLGRIADILDVAAVVALAPVACAVLDLYSWVRGLAG